jgi:hypothetical membrane protein
MFGILRNIFDPKIAVWFGIITPIFAITSISVAIILSPWFSWTYNALSDLGISPVAPIFNVGLIVTGILLGVFTIALIRVEWQKKLGVLGSLSLLSAGISTACIGVFTEAYMGIHILFALSCFISLTLSCILFTLRFAIDSETRIFAGLTLSTIILHIIVWVIISPSYGSIPIENFEVFQSTPIALLEIFIAFPFLPWYIALCLRLKRNRDGANTVVKKDTIHDSA